MGDDLIFLGVHLKEGGLRIQLGQSLHHPRLLLAMGFDLSFECGLTFCQFE